MDKKTVAIVGNGSIAKHLAGRLEERGFKVIFFLRKYLIRSSFENFLEHNNPIAVFLAISTKDKGEAARDYILDCIIANTPVITCEKGSLSYHAHEFKNNLNWIGFSAAVGGGTMMLKYLRDRHFGDQVVEIKAILNGTLNFICDEISRGRSMGQACRDVVRLKYAEPGVTDNLSLINGEWKDLIMKTCVFFNTIFGKHQFINPTMFRGGKLTEKDLEKMSSGDYRFIVSFSNKNIFRSWNINPALYQVSLVEDQNRWIPGGVGNAVHVVEGEGEASIPYILSGPGAGLEPTTSAMLADFANHCRF